MVDRFETCRVYRATIPLSLLEISDLHTVPTTFYVSFNEKNWMCELCTFSQILFIFLYHVLQASKKVKFNTIVKTISSNQTGAIIYVGTHLEY